MRAAADLLGNTDIYMVIRFKVSACDCVSKRRQLACLEDSQAPEARLRVETAPRVYPEMLAW